jgi:hypothetical protein
MEGNRKARRKQVKQRKIRGNVKGKRCITRHMKTKVQVDYKRD